MLSRMDSDSDKKLTFEEMQAVGDEWLTHEVHIKSAQLADKNGDGVLTRAEFVHMKTCVESDLKEEL